MSNFDNLTILMPVAVLLLFVFNSNNIIEDINLNDSISEDIESNYNLCYKVKLTIDGQSFISDNIYVNYDRSLDMMIEDMMLPSNVQYEIINIC